MVRGAPDWVKMVSLRYVIVPPEELGRVIPVPLGSIVKRGTLDPTTDVYQDVASHVVTADKTFHLCKIVVSVNRGTWIRIMWDAEQIYPDVLVVRGIPFTDFFPWDWNPLTGDGVKAIKIQAKYEATAGRVDAELVGEEV